MSNDDNLKNVNLRFTYITFALLLSNKKLNVIYSDLCKNAIPNLRHAMKAKDRLTFLLFLPNKDKMCLSKKS